MVVQGSIAVGVLIPQHDHLWIILPSRGGRRRPPYHIRLWSSGAAGAARNMELLGPGRGCAYQKSWHTKRDMGGQLFEIERCGNGGFMGGKAFREETPLTTRPPWILVGQLGGDAPQL